MILRPTNMISAAATSQQQQLESRQTSPRQVNWLQDLLDASRRLVNGRQRRWKQQSSSTEGIFPNPQRWRPCPQKGVTNTATSWSLATASHQASVCSAKLPTPCNFVFLEPGRLYPVPISWDHRRCAGKLLLLSGDVETNPGPVESRRQAQRSQPPRIEPMLPKNSNQPKSKQKSAAKSSP